ncbi:uncharacterized protein DSM5745_03827 [Aspergillus mulundensis]|uniref:AB hydrolase-1 domain-containing protein n=1 Tax=Aspergillus mulundensis TaxID=1810919 RepID=A0A3D8SLG8_9EURO|nr:hypothetical protein DSM5745_03827 [Aspergillus mulundensis]RDW87185.1 hypothetical protein DSM5745_03827 [Aspergillus mulundensis]
MTDPLKTLETEPRYCETSISRKAFPIAGIQTTVFGLDELPPQASEIACLWLLHPRLAAFERMVPIATAVINDWNKRTKTGHAGSRVSIKGLIAVAFDQRNHGTRLVDPLCNESWKKGNPRHAQDMFSVFQGTARDTSLLMDYLPAFVFPKTDRRITENLVLGVSLGGHAAWSCILHEPRISTGIVIIGCPDYANVMADRARLSKLPSWKDTTPEGAQFLGSEDFPSTLLDAVRKWDPAGLFLNHLDLSREAEPIRSAPIPEPTETQKTALRPLFTQCLAGKKILNLSGGKDKLVPYSKGETFLTWLKQAVGPDGWFADGAVTLEDIIDQNAAHEVTPKMVDQAVRFIGDALACGKDEVKKASVRDSKI